MSDRTTSRSSSSTSPSVPRAARRRPGGARRHPAAGLALVLFLATPAAPVLAADPACPSIEARAELAEPRPGDVYLAPGAASCAKVEIDVIGRGLEGVFTASFTLRYPAALLRYEGYTTGGLLAEGPPRTPPLYLVRTPAPGRIVVTMTRFAPDGGAGVPGDAAFMALRFGRLAAGTAVIDFDAEPPGGGQRILGASGEAIAARFSPGHGAAVTIP